MLNGAGAAVPPSGPARSTRGAAIKANAAGEIHEEDLLLLAVDLDGLTVTDALPAYGMPEDPLLPMGELSRLLDLNINVSPGVGQIIGTIGQSQRPLTIDLASRTFRLNGRAIDLSPEDVAVTASDIYLRVSAVQKVLPITIKADTEGLQLNMHALEVLPIQARLNRLSALRNLQPDAENDNEPALRLPTPYSLITPPSFDISGSLGAGAIAPRFPHSYDVRIAGDVLWTGFQGYLGSDINGRIASARASFRRDDPKGRLLGPLHATSASVGDVFTPSLPIGPRGGTGRGFEFSSAPLEQASVFNRIDLRGELPVGYDVELYINDVLRSGQRTPTQGRYEFLNVPLVRGVNVIRIVTNGPRGERTEETRIINVGGGQLAKGKFNFAMGAVQQDTPLINLANANALGDIQSPGAGKLRVSANAAYGLSTGLTLVGGASLFPTTVTDEVTQKQVTKSREMGTVGIRTSILGAAVQVDVAADSEKSAALAFGAAAQPFGVSTLVRQVFYRGPFIDETVGFNSADKPILSHSEINTDFNVRAMRNSIIPLTLRGTVDYYKDGVVQSTAGFRTSSSIRNVLLSGGLDLQSTYTPGIGTALTTAGNLSASTFYQFKWQIRADLNYSVSPKFSVNDLNITVDRELGANQALRLGVGQGFGGGAGTTFQLGDIIHTTKGDISLTGNVTLPSNQWQLGLTFATGLVYDPYARRYVVTRPGPAQSGSVAFQTFVDSNGNGIFDAGEKPVPDATIDGGEKRATSDAKGHALITGVGTGPSGRLQVGLDAIEDPYVQSPPHTITFAPRPGLVIKAPYPLTSSSEIIIHVLLQRDNTKVGLSAVRVRLTPIKGGAQAETTTEFDGSAGFDALRPGTYRLELDPEQSKRLRMRLTEPLEVVAPADGGPLPDRTVFVVFDPAPTPGQATAAQ